MVTSVRTHDEGDHADDPRWYPTAQQMGLQVPQYALFEELGERIRPMFARPEPHRQAMLYMLGLLGQVERKNSWQLADFAGEASPWRMQRLLNRARWDADGVLGVARDLVTSRLAEHDAVLSLGEIGVIKKGTSSVAVARQFSEVTQQVDNCQVGVFAAYVSGRGGGLIDRELFLPESWAADADRCRRAGVPGDRAAFLAKPELASRIVERILAAGSPFTWVSAGLAYGRDESLRRWLETRRLRYVLAVPPVPRLLRRLPAHALRQRRYGTSATGGARRVEHDWLAVPVGWAAAEADQAGRGRISRHPDGRADGFVHSLLLRRGQGERSQPACYLVHAPHGTPTASMVAAVKAQRVAAQCLRSAQEQVGMDRYEVRTWTAWYRHVTLALLALADPALRADQARPRSGSHRNPRGAIGVLLTDGASPLVSEGHALDARTGKGRTGERPQGWAGLRPAVVRADAEPVR